MSRMRFIKIIIIIGLLFGGGTVFARDFLNMGTCIVDKDTVIEGNLFVLCQNLTIHGTVRGDVIGAAVSSEFFGDVIGNIYLVSGQLDVHGRVTKDLHFGGVVLRLNPPIGNVSPTPPENAEPEFDPPLWVGGSLKAVTLSVMVYPNTIIDDGILNAGYQLILDGDVQNEISFWGSALLISGTVDGDIYATVGNPEAESRTLETLLIPFKFDVELVNPGLRAERTAIINGDLRYTGPVKGRVQGFIAGEMFYQEIQTNVIPTLEEPGSLRLYLSQVGREFTTLLVIGAVGIIIVPSFLDAPLRNLRTRPFSSFSVGMLTFLLSFPVVLILVVLSAVIIFLLRLVGLDGLVFAVGVVLGLVNLGGVSLFYFFAIYVARALVALAFGRFLLRSINQHQEGTVWYLAELALGLVFLAALVSLPFFGLLFNAGALFMGLGTILNIWLVQFRRWRDAAPTPAPAWYEPSPLIAHRALLRGDGQEAKMAQMVDSNDEAFEMDDTEQPASQMPTIIPAPLPQPEDDNPYPLTGTGMTNLPDGFDFSFFDTHTAEEEPDE